MQSDLPCRFRAVGATLDRKQAIRCHLLPCKLLHLRFHADSIPSALTMFRISDLRSDFSLRNFHNLRASGTPAFYLQ